MGDVIAVVEHAIAVPPARDGSREAVPGDAPAVQQLRATITAIARDPSPVLVIGETGTGKELIAHELHRLSGRAGPLVAFNCAELSPTVVESQLFGHERGAFTGAAKEHRGLFREADGGTLFLDEIGELVPELQPKLLRAIQSGTVQCPVAPGRYFLDADGSAGPEGGRAVVNLFRRPGGGSGGGQATYFGHSGHDGTGGGFYDPSTGDSYYSFTDSSGKRYSTN